MRRKAQVSTNFSDRILAWFEDHGRKDLPWQRQITSYRVWVSEIMLQQTQVTTVIPYFERFVARFPDVQALAAAPLDEVLHHWSGLGYYARARNLHRAARIVCNSLSGVLPTDLEGMQSLPGVGRSTAGAVLSLAGGQRQVILDGNVKRVLARYRAVSGWPGSAEVLRQLWQIAEAFTPDQRVAEYNQAMMDLGATLCTRTRPACGECPLQSDCAARALGRVTEFPGKRPRKTLPCRSVRMLLVRDPAGAVLLERRASAGVWGGLWSLPEIAADADPLGWCMDELHQPGEVGRVLATRRHTFSHFHLDIEPCEILLKNPVVRVLEAGSRLWYNARSPEHIGLAAPVARLIDEIAG